MPTSHASPHTATGQFTFDGPVLARSLNVERDGDCGLRNFGDGPAEQIAAAVMRAEDAGALKPPTTTALYVVRTPGEQLLLTVCETHEIDAPTRQTRQQHGLPLERQLATWETEPAWLSEQRVNSFSGLCHTLREVCSIANKLHAALGALRLGEAHTKSLLAEPLRIVKRNDRGRLSTRVSSVMDLAEHDPQQTVDLWPLLIETLETGEATEDWDGDRQRTLLLRTGGATALAVDLIATRRLLVNAGTVAATAMPDPKGGFSRHLP